MPRENCRYQLRSQPRRSTSKFSIDCEKNLEYPKSLIKFRVSLRCLVRLIRITKFLDRQCVRRSPKVSGGMLRLSVIGNRSAVVAVEIRPPLAHTKIGALACYGSSTDLWSSPGVRVGPNPLLGLYLSPRSYPASPWFRVSYVRGRCVCAH